MKLAKILTWDPEGAADPEHRERVQKVPLQPTSATQANEATTKKHQATLFPSSLNGWPVTRQCQYRHFSEGGKPPTERQWGLSWDQPLSCDRSEVTVELHGKTFQVGYSSREVPDTSKHGMT